MKVAVAVMPDCVSATEVTGKDGRFIATDELYIIHPDERLGRVPYERLRELGEGVHELAEEDRQIRDQVNDDGRFPSTGRMG